MVTNQSTTHQKHSQRLIRLTKWGVLSQFIRPSEQPVDLQIQQREVEGIIILDLRGRLILGQEDLLLRQTIRSLADAAKQRLILNLKDVSDVDTAALGTLIYCGLKFRESGGRLVLLNLAPSHAKLSDIMKLNTTFETYQDEHLAVNSFFPERVVPHYDILDFVEELENERPTHEFPRRSR